MKRKNTKNTQAVITNKKNIWRKILSQWQLYLMLLPLIIYFLVFSYAPMAGVQIAFRDYTFKGGIWGSKFVGLKHFKRFITSVQFPVLMKNTLSITLANLIFAFPFPIILALLLNETRFLRLKKFIQTLTYAPYFISTVVFCSMITLFLSPSNGVINKFIELVGGTEVEFLGYPEYFVPIMVISEIWKGTGWNAIIYVAALSNVDQQLHEAAKMDGASRLQRIWHIDIPSIMPTVVILFIMKCGNIMSVGYEKVFLLQNSMNISASEVISTYVYKTGLIGMQYSYTAAIGLFNSVVNVIMLVIANTVSKKINEASLF